MPPLIFSQPNEQRVRDGDVVIFFNFRADRARQLSQAFLDPRFQRLRSRRPAAGPIRDAHAIRRDLSFALRLRLRKRCSNILGEVVSAAGKTQLRIAETEKYPHVTYFFNGGVESAFPGEERQIVPSPKVATLISSLR